VALCMHDELVPPWMGSNASTPPRIGHACGLCSKPTSSIQYSRRRKKSTAHESSSQFVVVRGALVIRRFDRENAVAATTTRAGQSLEIEAPSAHVAGLL
jgi:hypothetical protein